MYGYWPPTKCFGNILDDGGGYLDDTTDYSTIESIFKFTLTAGPPRLNSDTT